jgi:biotin transporter BioY
MTVPVDSSDTNSPVFHSRSDTQSDFRSGTPAPSATSKPAIRAIHRTPVSPKVALQKKLAERSFWNRSVRYPRAGLIPFLLMLSGVLILVLLSFIVVMIPKPSSLSAEVIEAWMSSGAPPAFDFTSLTTTGLPTLDAARVWPGEWMDYGFQPLFAIFWGALLGPVFGAFSVLGFLIVGLSGFPVFTLGGGSGYVEQEGFGYLLGMVFASFLVGKTFRMTTLVRYGWGHRFFLKLMLATFAVLLVHGTGTLFLVWHTVSGQLSWPVFMEHWKTLSGYALVYDFIFSVVVMYLIRPVRFLLGPLFY